MERHLAKGRTHVQIAASSLYVACRQKGVLMTLDDVVVASGVGRDDIAKCYRLLVTEFDLKIPVADPADYMSRVASRAGVHPEVEADAREMLARAAKAGITAGVYPNALAASALYLASVLRGENLTQGRAAEAAEVREATVRKQYKRMRKVLGVQLGAAPRKRSPRQSVLEQTPPTGVEVRRPRARVLAH
jgi:transcription initiation factor TFIIB